MSDFLYFVKMISFEVSQGVPLAADGFVSKAYCQTWRTRRFSRLNQWSARNWDVPRLSVLSILRSPNSG
jgi:hypothetical protein